MVIPCRVSHLLWYSNVVASYSYDLNGSLTNVVYSDGTPSIAYTHDARGNLVSATVDGVSTNLYAYDVFGNLTNEVQNGTGKKWGQTPFFNS